MPHTTLGVDLAGESKPKKTAYCLIEWGKLKARIIELRCGADDARLLEMFGHSNKIGIDAPFGWPTVFADAVYAHQRQNVWPAVCTASLRYRTTDHIVRERIKRWPLSVSSDLIGVTAMRAARLLSETGPIDRSGYGRFVEVYPAAALHIWGFSFTSYKENKGKENRRALTHCLMTATEKWLDWSGDAQQASTTRSMRSWLLLSLGLRPRIRSSPFRKNIWHTAKQEGWIALPLDGSLASLTADV